MPTGDLCFLGALVFIVGGVCVIYWGSRSRASSLEVAQQQPSELPATASNESAIAESQAPAAEDHEVTKQDPEPQVASVNGHELLAARCLTKEEAMARWNAAPKHIKNEHNKWITISPGYLPRFVSPPHNYIHAFTGESESLFIYRLTTSPQTPESPTPAEVHHNSNLSVESLHSRVTELVAVEDYPAIGELTLEVLLLPSQEHEPRDTGLYLAQNMRAIVELRTGYPKKLSHRSFHREFLPIHLRGQWTEDTFPHLLIYAYVLGARWCNLPAPYCNLYKYYFESANHIRADLYSEGQQFRERAMKAQPPTVTRDQIAGMVSELVKLGMSPEAIADQIAGLVAQPQVKLTMPGQPLTPEDFQ